MRLVLINMTYLLYASVPKRWCKLCKFKFQIKTIHKIIVDIIKKKYYILDYFNINITDTNICKCVDT